MILGELHPDHLLHKLSALQIEEWRRFDRIEPIGELRADFRAGQICATLGNIHRKEESEPFTATDFMPWLDGVQPTRDEVLLPDAEAQSRMLLAALFKLEKNV